jgi:hypothetical protein
MVSGDERGFGQGDNDGKVIAQQVSGDAVLLSYCRPVSDGGAPITAYTIQILPTGEFVVVDGKQTSATISGLSAGVPYTFRARALNKFGAGPWSERSSAVQLGTVPGKPSNLRAQQGNQYSETQVEIESLLPEGLEWGTDIFPPVHTGSSTGIEETMRRLQRPWSPSAKEDYGENAEEGSGDNGEEAGAGHGDNGEEDGAGHREGHLKEDETKWGKDERVEESEEHATRS